MITYKPLFRLLIDNNLNKTDIMKITGCSSRTLAKLSKNKFVSLSLIDKLCSYFKCPIENIIEHYEK